MSILISLPGEAIQDYRFSGSLPSLVELRDLDLPATIRQAIDAIEQVAEPSGVPAKIVVRPEMFTHGESLEWLMTKAGPVSDHISISSGSTIRVIPGVFNHVFFYDLHTKRGVSSAEKLLRRAPELFASMYSQVNSALVVYNQALRICPPTWVLRARGASSKDAVKALPMVNDGAGPAINAARSRTLAAPLDELLPRFTSASLILMSEMAMADEAYMRRVLAALDQAFSSPDACTLIYIERSLSAASSEPAVLLFLSEVARRRSAAPRIEAANIFFVTDLPSRESWTQVPTRRVVSHLSVPLWTSPDTYWRLFHDLEFFGQGANVDRPALSSMVCALTGFNLAISWTDPRGFGDG